MRKSLITIAEATVPVLPKYSLNMFDLATPSSLASPKYSSPRDFKVSYFIEFKVDPDTEMSPEEL